MTLAWNETLKEKLIETVGAAEAERLFLKYGTAFPTHYQEDCSPYIAVKDILQMEKLTLQNAIDINFYVSEDSNLHLRLFQFHKFIPLSDVLPMLENMDLRTFNERPYELSIKGPDIWISDFTVTYAKSSLGDIEKVKDLFQESFINTRLGFIENDGFNKLILGAQLSSREIVILRAYAKYLRQAGFIFTQPYIEKALINNTNITKKLVEFFEAKHNPTKNKEAHAEELEAEILRSLESVRSLDEDRILRRILQLIKATLRTNYFQTQANGAPKEYLAFKFSSREIPDLPLPLPLFEIFIYSPRFEGIHLRNAKVARGGIRWSDRLEDFRTEVLGLMKAQKVKNAVIVPSGAKGGFVLKAVPANAAREALQLEGVTCYKFFLRGLLDITDNLVKGKVVRPENVKCYDEEDTYLVVAADKGTASFSDTANSISKEYNFWLGDAFASGGSVGYDHKKMGITARGAWESIKRLFRELNINIAETEFTAVGIGDMSGDVFGNGAIYSDKMKLVAAFDHRDIFIDPSPDAKLSHAERVRLFNLPTSSWQNYSAELISKGGGVFSRSSKSITLSPEIQKVLDITESALAPNELIRAILKAPVDLLFNGGIGTYVKASTESQAEVGDKTNEYCRINGGELRCRAVGEGGNLGFTQLGRIEYALQKNGLISTDFIDNSAGVDCSDHEVNIKILLNQEVAKGNITEEQRNVLLASMTQQVADLVLNDNYNQAFILSFINFYSTRIINHHIGYIKELEHTGSLDRIVEFLPDEKKLIERKTSGLGLTRPELAVLLAYTKIHLKAEILKSDIPKHSYLSQIVVTAFPEILRKKYLNEMYKHSLSSEIIATQLSNQIVNEMGILFVYDLQTETGASIEDIILAYTAASRVFGSTELQQLIISLDYKIPMAMQYEMLSHIRRLIYLSTRWFLRHKALKDTSALPKMIEHYTECINTLGDIIPTLMGGVTKTYLESLTDNFVQAGISPQIAKRIAAARAMYTALNITEVATHNHFDLIQTAKLYFVVGEFFNLLWFRDQIAGDTREGFWDSLARVTLRDELDILQKQLTVSTMKHGYHIDKPRLAIDEWITHHPDANQRWDKMLEVLHTSTSTDYVMFFIALRELTGLIHITEKI
ncbi:MAG: NAD-glutamate dehydrogenase [Gammaproteobacteria bacterium]|nr:NAD-glutamate dehydrogenase [Gammaproteobacteria bacterium]